MTDDLLHLPALALLLATAAPAQAGYTLTTLGTAPGATVVIPAAINVHGEVVGTVHYATTWHRAFRWTPAGGLSLLPPPPGVPAGAPNTAMHLNDAGVIVGYAGTSPQVAWSWHNGQYSLLGSRPGFPDAQAWRINNAGEIIGIVGSALTIDNFYRDAAGAISDPTPGYWGLMHDLNDAGLACGTDLGNGVTVWDLRAGTRQGYGLLPGYPTAFGTAIDAFGRVCGYGANSFANGNGLEQSFVLVPGSPLAPITVSPGRRKAMSTNRLGTVVGVDVLNGNVLHGGWTWTAAAGLVELRAQIPDPAAWSSVSYPGDQCDAINDVGQVLALGTRADGSHHALLLTPQHFAAPAGPGCAGALGVADLRALSAPRRGGTFHLRVDGLPLDVAVMLAGAPITPGLDLGPLGLPGCTLRAAADSATLLLGAANAAVWSAAVPDDPALVGVTVHCQALVPDPAANPFGASLSRAVAVTVLP